MQALKKEELKEGESAASESKDSVELKKVRSNIEVMDTVYQKDVFYSTPIVKNRDINHRESLLRMILGDFGNNFFTYMLCIVFCCLAVLKVAQVQETRNVIANMNELSIHNENLNKIWLSLLAQRQNLSEHSKIRNDAYNKLKMQAPKTDAENVIYLD